MTPKDTPMSTPKESRPDPDPTTLTTQQLERVVTSLRDLIEAKIISLEKIVDIRQQALDHTVTQLRLHDEKRQQVIEKQTDHLESLINEKFNSINEKFNSIDIQFLERDKRSEQTARDSKVAVDAAFAASKEANAEQNKSSALAIAKSEAATTKQIDQQGVLITTTTAGLNEKIEDLKERFIASDRKATERNASGEGHSKGIGDVFAYIVGAVGLLTAIIATVAAVMAQ